MCYQTAFWIVLTMLCWIHTNTDRLSEDCNNSDVRHRFLFSSVVSLIVWMLVCSRLSSPKCWLRKEGSSWHSLLWIHPGLGMQWTTATGKECIVWSYQMIVRSLLPDFLFFSLPDVSLHLSSWQPVINYIDSKCEDFLNAESRVNRRSMPDNRVHCCLYFIAPSGHGYVCMRWWCNYMQ